MGFFGYLLLIVAVAVATIAFLASRKPDVFKVERRALIKAPPEAIFDQINALAAWEHWSPWAKKDPNMKSAYAGPASGAGSAMSWDGDRNVGRGRMEITQSVPPSRIVMRLEFLAPMKATNTATFTLTPKDGGTEVHWAMHGPNQFMGKVMSLFMDMDKMVGGDFEKGLESLRARVGG